MRHLQPTVPVPRPTGRKKRERGKTEKEGGKVPKVFERKELFICQFFYKFAMLPEVTSTFSLDLRQDLIVFCR